MGLCWMIQGEFKGVEANSGWNISGGRSNFVIVYLNNSYWSDRRTTVGWASPWWGKGAAVTPVRQKRGMLHRFCGCRVALFCLILNIVMEWPGLDIVSVLWVWFIFNWEHHGLAASRTAFSPGFRCIYLFPFLEGKEGSHILEGCQGLTLG